MAKIIKLGKRKYVAGMRWGSFEKHPSKAELREDASRLGLDLETAWGCVRVGEASIQAGFCESISRKRPSGLYSLAASIVDSKRQPWLGVFRVGEGMWWYIAVRDGHAILPDGDVIGGEEEIQEARARHSGYTDWEYVDGDVKELLEIIETADVRPAPVRPLKSSIPVAQIAVCLVLICAGIGGFFTWKHHKEALEMRALALARAKQQQAPPPPSPLLTIPLPDVWLSACGKVITGLPLSLYGWSLDTVTCQPTAVNVHWVRSPGAIVAHRPEGGVSPNGEAIDQSLPLTLDKTGPEDAINLPEASLILRSWAQAAGFALMITNQPAPLPGSQPADVPPPPPQSQIIVEMPVSPFGMDIKIPGLRLNRLMSTATGWRIEGVLYGH
jgi:hypothetical protein